MTRFLDFSLTPKHVVTIIEESVDDATTRKIQTSNIITATSHQKANGDQDSFPHNIPYHIHGIAHWCCKAVATDTCLGGSVNCRRRDGSVRCRVVVVVVFHRCGGRGKREHQTRKRRRRRRQAMYDDDDEGESTTTTTATTTTTQTARPFQSAYSTWTTYQWP